VVLPTVVRDSTNCHKGGEKVNNKVITTRRMAQKLKKSVSYITELARSGRLPPAHRTESGHYLFTRGTLASYLWKKDGLQGILNFINVKAVVDEIGSDIEKFFGEEPGCIVCCLPGGLLYGLAFLSHLNSRGKDITMICMGHRAGEWEPEDVDGRKALLVDLFSITGGTFNEMEKKLRERCQEADIKIGEVKAFAYDRFGDPKRDPEGNPRKYPNFFIRGSYKEHMEDIDVKFLEQQAEGQKKRSYNRHPVIDKGPDGEKFVY